MLFELSMAKRGRKCKMCGGHIGQDKHFFIQTTWIPNVTYPTKANVCLECAGKLTDDVFIEYFETLLAGLKRLKANLKSSEVF